MKIYILQHVNARIFGKDKMRISAVLTILADGTKLSPLLIFKRKNEPKRKRITKKM